MEKRHYLLLVFDDGRSDKLQPYAEDVGGAIEKLTTMQQEGGPDGIAAAIVVTSTGRVLRHSRLYSKAWHKNQTKTAQDTSASELRVLEDKQRELLEQRADIDRALADAGYVAPPPPPPPAPTPESILESFEALKATAEGLGVALPLAAPQAPAPEGSSEGGNVAVEGSASASDAAAPGAPELALSVGPGAAGQVATGARARNAIPSLVPPRAPAKDATDGSGKA